MNRVFSKDEISYNLVKVGARVVVSPREEHTNRLSSVKYSSLKTYASNIIGQTMLYLYMHVVIIGENKTIYLMEAFLCTIA